MTLRSWWMWFWAALFYAFEFYIRIFPNAAVADLMRDFHLSAAQLGALSAYYYYAYALMQIPVGFWVDRCSVKMGLWLGTILVTLGTAGLSQTHTYAWALVCRVLQGAGSAFAFIGTLRLAMGWFSERQFSLVVGLTNSMGILGALCGSALLGYWLQDTHWSVVLWSSAQWGWCLACALWLFVWEPPKHPLEVPHFEFLSLWQSLGDLLKHRSVLYFTVLASLMVVPVTTFTELWGPGFLQQSLSIARSQATLLSSLTFLGIALGGPFWGMVHGRRGTHRGVFAMGVALSMGCLMAIVYGPWKHVWLQGALLWGMGVGCSSMLLCFSLNRAAVAESQRGLCMGLTNTGVMALGAAFQPMVGWWMDHAAVKAGVLSAVSLQGGFQWVMVCQGLALLMIAGEPYGLSHNVLVKRS